MCHHDKKDKKLLERADESGSSYKTDAGEQLVECRECGDVHIRHPQRD